MYIVHTEYRSNIRALLYKFSKIHSISLMTIYTFMSGIQLHYFLILIVILKCKTTIALYC